MEVKDGAFHLTSVAARPPKSATLPQRRPNENPRLSRIEEVGDPGFEPGTSALSERRSNRLS